MLIAPGTRVRRYEVTAELGAGGMGEVWLARDVELDRTVALKILPQDGADSPDRTRRFLQEAKAAITLNHPNVAHVYDVGEEDGVRFMAMEYVQGETLRARLSRERLSVDTVLEIAIQISAALGSAHDAGIVHRDVKPENVMVRPDGYVKVLDFGLAKLTIRGMSHDDSTQVFQTAPGVVMGTMHYMSPEQLRGDDVDARTDVFSLGVLLYEMVSGRRPFEATTPSGVIAAILTEAPPPLDQSVPFDVRAIIARAMAKNRDDRYRSATELTDALKQARRETHRIRSGDVPTQVLTTSAPRRMPMKWIAVTAAVVVAIAIAAWYANRARNVRNARTAVPRIEKLAEERRYFEAYDLAKTVEPHLAGDARLAGAMAKIVVPISITTTPDGAEVWLERVTSEGETAPRMLAGTTPLKDHAVPLGDYVATIEKSGFAPSSFTIALSPIREGGMTIARRPARVARTLVKDVPERMTAVPGGPYRLSSWSRPTVATVTLAPYFIDQFEVSNREFARFVDGGGYQRPELWKHPFVKDGRTLTMEEAMRELRDTTGLNAPRGWAQQKYPVGRDDDPVTGVTWYEAAAYAAFVGKSLPTIFQWEKAARDGNVSPFGMTYPWGVVPAGVDVSRRANFRGSGPMRVDSLRGGMSPYGAYHMAGNVAEWCANGIDDGRAALGATYDSPAYQFGALGSFPPFYSSEKLGFRCAKVDRAAGDQGSATYRRSAEVPVITPLPPEKFREFLPYFDYPQTPLNARVVERTVADAWIKEKIAYTGARGETVHAFLFLPKNHKPPYQVVHYLPAGDVVYGARSLDASIETMLGAFIRSGRAFFGVLLPGYIGRERPEGPTPGIGSEEFAEHLTNEVIDERRGIDYLLTRPDIDGARIAFYGQSSGAHVGLIIAAVEKRYRSVLLAGVGFTDKEARVLPRVSRYNFAPYVDTPLLLVQGRWDESHPLDTEAMPLYGIFPDPKEIVVFDGGHVPPPEVAIPTFNGWWDKTLGPVTR
jgi:formylglycine-generating enzyme required for sulfatase activity/predicted Ser/Thr protein kinase